MITFLFFRGLLSKKQREEKNISVKTAPIVNLTGELQIVVNSSFAPMNMKTYTKYLWGLGQITSPNHHNDDGPVSVGISVCAVREKRYFSKKQNHEVFYSLNLHTWGALLLIFNFLFKFFCSFKSKCIINNQSSSPQQSLFSEIKSLSLIFHSSALLHTRV